MRQRGLTQEVDQLGRSLDHRLHRRVLGVKDAQRVGVQATLAVFIEQIGVGLEVSDQGLAMGLALFRLTQAVELQGHVFAHLQAEVTPQGGRHEDEFGVDVGTCKAQHLRAHLVELAIAALLRALVAEHRADVVQALAAFVQETVLVDGTHGTGRALGAQRELVAVEAVFEGVHLLLDDVGDLAQAAHEQGRGLDDGRAHVLEAVAAHQLTHLVFQPLPARRFRRQDVVHAFDGFELFGHVWEMLLVVVLVRRAEVRPTGPGRSGARCSSAQSRGTLARCGHRAGSGPFRRR